MEHFALAVIGAGSGNVVIPREPADGPVALIESGAFGGTCINRGCIPSKILAHTADVARTVREAAAFGIGAELIAVYWPAIRDRTFAQVDKVASEGRRGRAESDRVRLISGRARFTGPHELVIDDRTLISADRIVLATGARPVIPPVIADSGVPFETSDTVMRIDKLPETLVIVGGSYIGVEFAHIFSSFGVTVRLVNRDDRLLEAFDTDISARFTALGQERWDVHLSAEITSMSTGGAGAGAGVTLNLQDGTTVTGDLLLVAAGREPDTGDLDLDLAGVRLREDGRIEVDEFGRTTAGHIWSLGDASSPYELKHVANAEARAVKHNLAHPDDLRPLSHDWVPAAVFSEPQVATVGARQQDLAGQRRFVQATHEYRDVAYGWALQDTSGFCRIYADPASGELLGAHIIGYQASLLIQPLVQAASTGLPVHEMARGQYWIHPALSEVVENALLDLPLDGR